MNSVLKVCSALSLSVILLSGLLLAAFLFIHSGDRSWWEFLTTVPKALGTKGGIASVLVNTLWIVGCAMLISTVSAMASTLLVLQLDGRHPRVAGSLRTLTEVGASTPRLLWGIGGAALFGQGFGLGLSAACGVLSLACVLAPILSSGFMAALEQQRTRLMPACRSLGLTERQAWLRYIAPAAAPAIFATLIQGIGRGLGDAAALFLTAGSALYWLEGPDRPAATLAVYAYTVALDVTGGLENAYAAATVLLVLTALIQAPLIHIQRS